MTTGVECGMVNIVVERGVAYNYEMLCNTCNITRLPAIWGGGGGGGTT